MLKAQLACGYGFRYSSNIPFTALPEGQGTLILASGAASPSDPDPDTPSPTDEDFFAQQPIGFPFQFNGSTYTHVGVATNGWIWFGANGPVKAAGLVFPFTQVLNSEFPIEGIASALNGDLEGRWTAGDARIRTRASGTAPNRSFTIEWSNFKSLDDAEGTGFCGENRNRFDFQIILEEQNNTLVFAYNTAPYCWQGYEQFFQVGLRGNGANDVHARSITAGAQAWANSSLGFSHSTAVLRSSSPTTLPAQNARFSFYPSTAQTLTWLGTNTNWFDASNWSGNEVPGRCNAVLIPSGRNHYPELTGSLNVQCGHLEIQSGAALSLQTSYHGYVSVFGDLRNDGILTNNTPNYINLAGGPNRSISGEGYFIGTDLFITAQSEYRLEHDLVLRNLKINDGSALRLQSHVLDVYGIQQIGVLDQGTGVLVIEGDAASVSLHDSTFVAAQGTTFFGCGELWADLHDQTVPSLQYYNLWVRTNKNHTVWLGTGSDFSCHNLMFYNPGEPGGLAETARNISLSGTLSLGIDSMAGTELRLNHRLLRAQDGGSFVMGENDRLFIQYSNGSTVPVISGFQNPDFKGLVTYSSASSQTVMKGRYGHINIQGSGHRTANGKVELRGVLRLLEGSFDTADSLLLRSDSLGTALISGQGDGILSGELEIERYVDGEEEQYLLFGTAFSSLAWESMSNDLSTNTSAAAPVWGNNGIWEYREEESNPGFGAGWHSRNQSETHLAQMKGYLISVQGGRVLRARGQLQSENPRVALRVSPGNTVLKGWNLVSNPYPSPVDWNKVLNDQPETISRTMLKAGSGNRYAGHFGAWLPLGSNEGLGTNGATRYIGSQEGFFVKAFQADTLQFMREHRVEVLNTRAVQVPEQIPYLKLSLVQGSSADETAIYFSSQASNSEAFDATDALKVPSLNGKSWWYSNKDSMQLAIQGRFRLQGTDTIPLTVVVAQSGAMQVRLSEAVHLEATAMVFLEDRESGAMHNLRQNPVVNLNLNAGTLSGRFYLHVREGVKVSSYDAGCTGHEGRIHLNNATATMWDVEVFNSVDSLIGTKNQLSGMWEWNTLPAGEYRLHFSMIGIGPEVEEWITVAAGNAITAQWQITAPETLKPGEDALEIQCLNPNAEQVFWDLGDGQLLSGVNEIQHVYEEAGTYSVVMTVVRGTCSDTAMTHVQVILVTGMEEGQQAQVLRIFPNPAQSTAYLNVGIQEMVKSCSGVVVDIQGRVVYQIPEQSLSPGKLIELPVQQLPAGHYEVAVFLDGKRKGARLSVQR